MRTTTRHEVHQPALDCLPALVDAGLLAADTLLPTVRGAYGQLHRTWCNSQCATNGDTAPIPATDLVALLHGERYSCCPCTDSRPLAPGEDPADDGSPRLALTTGELAAAEWLAHTSPDNIAASMRAWRGHPDDEPAMEVGVLRMHAAVCEVGQPGCLSVAVAARRAWLDQREAALVDSDRYGTSRRNAMLIGLGNWLRWRDGSGADDPEQMRLLALLDDIDPDVDDAELLAAIHATPAAVRDAACQALLDRVSHHEAWYQSRALGKYVQPTSWASRVQTRAHVAETTLTRLPVLLALAMETDFGHMVIAVDDGYEPGDVRTALALAGSRNEVPDTLAALAAARL